MTRARLPYSLHFPDLSLRTKVSIIQHIFFSRSHEFTTTFSHFPPAPKSFGRGISCTRLVKSTRLVKCNKMQQKVAKTGWELAKVARIGRSRSVYGQKRVEGGVGQSREPKLSVCCLRTCAQPFLAKNRPGAPVFGHFPIINVNYSYWYIRNQRTILFLHIFVQKAPADRWSDGQPNALTQSMLKRR